MRDTALFLHILGVLAFAAGVSVAGVAFEVARRRREPAEIALILGLARMGVRFVVVGVPTLLGFGLWLVHLEHFSLGEGWIAAAIALFGVALALGTLGGRSPRRARELAATLADRGAPMDDDLRALLDDRLSRAANYASAATVVAILALMVFKP